MHETGLIVREMLFDSSYTVHACHRLQAVDATCVANIYALSALLFSRQKHYFTPCYIRLFGVFC